MQKRRVVITGTGVVSPFGRGADLLFASLLDGKSAVVRLDEPAYAGNPGPQVAGLVRGVDISIIPRKNRRSMSSMSAYTLMAAQDALQQAGIADEVLAGGRLGMSVGSTLGSVATLESVFAEYLPAHGLDNVKSMMFFKIMGHSVAANVAQALGITGRVMGASAACSSGAQSIGFGYEAVAYGMQDYMLCGGADEYHPLVSGTFDIMAAASCAYNDRPEMTPRPFDAARDGVVCSEGTGIVLLESLDSAQARGATILGEIVGFSTSSSPSSIASPDPKPVYDCMQAALASADISAKDIDYINAHATGTLQGDAAESRAIHMLFGESAPVSSLKGYMGHTMAASGAIETVASLAMMRENVVLPTKNLENPAEECQGIRHVMAVEKQPLSLVLKNSFAFGGINCSLVLRNLK